MTKTKEKAGLRLSVKGSKLELPVLFRAEGSASAASLAKSTAGTSGFSYRTCCRTHRVPVQAPKVCPSCGPGVPMDKERTLKGYDVGGGNLVFLTHEQVEALRPVGDDSVVISGFLSQERVGAGFVPEVARLLGGVRALVPNTTSVQPGAAEAVTKRWAALLAMLEGRVAVAEVMHRGSFRYALLARSPTGAILAYDLYLPEDAYDVPTVDVPPLSAQEREAFAAKGAELAEGRAFSPEDVGADPFREARYHAVSAAARGETPPPAPAPATITKSEDLLALV